MDKKLISQAVKALELIDIYLYSSSVNRYDDVSDDNYPDNMSQQNKLSISADFLETEDDKQIIQAKVNLGLRFITEEDTLSEIEACYVAKYLQDKPISDDAIGEFLKFNVIHNVWPFWREHAFRVSSEARLPRPIITLFKE